MECYHTPIESPRGSLLRDQGITEFLRHNHQNALRMAEEGLQIPGNHWADCFFIREACLTIDSSGSTPELAQAALWFGDSLRELFSSFTQKLQFSELVEEHLSSADVEPEGRVTPSLLDRAIAVFEAENVGPALSLLDEAIATCDSNVVDCLFFRGLAYYYASQLKLSVEDFSTVLELGLDLLDKMRGQEGFLYQFLAKGLQKLNKHEGAILSFTEAIKRGDFDSELYFLRGFSLWKTSRPLEAVQDFTKVIDHDSSRADAFYARSASFLLLKKYDDALKDVRVALELGCRDPSCYLIMAQVHASRRCHFLAVRYCDQAIEQGLREAQVFLCRGLSYLSQRDYEPAVRDLLEAKRLGHSTFFGPETPLSEAFESMKNHAAFFNSDTIEETYVVALMSFLRPSVDDFIRFCFQLDSEDSRMSALFVSDLFKTVWLSTCLQRSQYASTTRRHPFQTWIVEIESPGIAYHLIQDCQHCEDQIVRWVWRDRRIIHWDSQPVDVDALLNDIESLVQFSRIQDPYELFESAEMQRMICQQLHSLLLLGLEQFLDDIHEETPILVIPDRHLFRLSFSCLLDSARNDYFVERHSFSVFPSIEMIRVLSQGVVRAMSEDEVVVTTRMVGRSIVVEREIVLSVPDDPEEQVFGLVVRMIEGSKLNLQETTEFVKNVSPRGVSCVLTGSTCTTSKVLECLTSLRPQCVHFQVHSSGTKQSADDLRNRKFLERYVTAGCLQCVDTVLYSSDIASLDLRGTDFVFLNSCDSGTGSLTDDGILGFYRCFFQAGVRSVLCTQWIVIDLVSNFVGRKFYRFHLFEGMNKSASLRKALIQFMSHSAGMYRGRRIDYREIPSIWAAYQLYGRPT